MDAKADVLGPVGIGPYGQDVAPKLAVKGEDGRAGQGLTWIEPVAGRVDFYAFLGIDEGLEELF